jgi:hypothetical protein
LFNENWSASISAIDVGAIYFSQDISNYHVSGYHEFEGAIIRDPDDNTDFWDEMIKNFNEDIESGANEDNFIYSIPPKVFASITYAFDKKKYRSKEYMNSCSYEGVDKDVRKHYLSFISYNRFLRRYLDWALGISYLGELTPRLAIQANYLFSPYDRTNFGIGASFRIKPIVLYFFIDNIPGLIDLNNASSAGVSLGFNVVL